MVDDLNVAVGNATQDVLTGRVDAGIPTQEDVEVLACGGRVVPTRGDGQSAVGIAGDDGIVRLKIRPVLGGDDELIGGGIAFVVDEILNFHFLSVYVVFGIS